MQDDDIVVAVAANGISLRRPMFVGPPGLEYPVVNDEPDSASWLHCACTFCNMKRFVLRAVCWI